MLVNITGNRCVRCGNYTQYYVVNGRSLERTNCGYCNSRGRNTRPGDRCMKYKEILDVLLVNEEASIVLPLIKLKVE